MFQHDTIIKQTGETAYQIYLDLKSFVSFFGDLLLSIAEAILHPRKILWNSVFHYMNVCGINGLPITALICYLSGIIIGYQAAVQMQKYGADAFLPGLVGCTMARELAPLMVALIATGRAGSAFAAEIGTMKVSEEINAMQTMGFSPFRFLVIPKLIAMVCMIPLLTIFGDLAGVAGGLTVGETQLHLPVEAYMQTTLTWVKPKYFFEGIFKSGVFALIITIIACWRGLRTGSDAIAVGKATTSTVVVSILMIVISDAIMAHFFNTIFFAR